MCFTLQSFTHSHADGGYLLDSSYSCPTAVWQRRGCHDPAPAGPQTPISTVKSFLNMQSFFPTDKLKIKRRLFCFLLCEIVQLQKKILLLNIFMRDISTSWGDNLWSSQNWTSNIMCKQYSVFVVDTHKHRLHVTWISSWFWSLLTCLPASWNWNREQTEWDAEQQHRVPQYSVKLRENCAWCCV